MSELKGKNVVLGITGSIASYKAAEIIRLIKDEGARVYPVMTRSATRLVHPATFQAMSGERVVSSLFKNEKDSLKHISLSALADILLIAPATANIIGKIAQGIADDILTTTVMAARAPIVIAPAMNERMYQNPLVQQNINKLKSVGYRFIGPAEGRLASGSKGKGRMSEPEVIVDFLKKILSSIKDFQGKSFIVTAGPTREPWDKVRFFSNYSSGKMGFAIAQEARDRGAKIILIAGPTCIEPPRGVKLYRVETARELREKVNKYFNEVNGLIMVSAVADFRPFEVKMGKISKEDKENITLKMVKNPDILEEIGRIKGGKILVGFCAANDITEMGAGFGVDTNKVVLLDSKGKLKSLPLMNKREVAREIWNWIRDLP